MASDNDDDRGDESWLDHDAAAANDHDDYDDHDHDDNHHHNDHGLNHDDDLGDLLAGMAEAAEHECNQHDSNSVSDDRHAETDHQHDNDRDNSTNVTNGNSYDNDEEDDEDDEVARLQAQLNEAKARKAAKLAGRLEASSTNTTATTPTGSAAQPALRDTNHDRVTDASDGPRNALAFTAQTSERKTASFPPKPATLDPQAPRAPTARPPGSESSATQSTPLGTRINRVEQRNLAISGHHRSTDQSPPTASAAAAPARQSTAPLQEGLTELEKIRMEEDTPARSTQTPEQRAAHRAGLNQLRSGLGDDAKDLSLGNASSRSDTSAASQNSPALKPRSDFFKPAFTTQSSPAQNTPPTTSSSPAHAASTPIATRHVLAVSDPPQAAKPAFLSPADVLSNADLAPPRATTSMIGQKRHDNVSLCVEPFSGLRLVNRVVPEASFAEMVGGRRNIPLVQLQSHVPLVIRGLASNPPVVYDWFTIGVLCDKGPVRTTKNGQPFVFWTLVDLKGNELSLFMFQKVASVHNKETIGAVFALLNPQPMPAKGGTGAQPAIESRPSVKIEEAGKLLKLGSSADLGFCKGKRKDGANCTMALDVTGGDYCKFHVAKAYKEKRSARMELNSNFAPKVFDNGWKQPAQTAAGKAPPPVGVLINRTAQAAASFRFAADGSPLSHRAAAAIMDSQDGMTVMLQDMQRKSSDAAKQTAQNPSAQQAAADPLAQVVKFCSPSARHLASEAAAERESDLRDSQSEPRSLERGGSFNGVDRADRQTGRTDPAIVRQLGFDPYHRNGLAKDNNETGSTYELVKKAQKIFQTLPGTQSDASGLPQLSAFGMGLQPAQRTVQLSTTARPAAKAGDEYDRNLALAVARVRMNGPIQRQDPNAIPRAKRSAVDPAAQEHGAENMSRSSAEADPDSQRNFDAHAVKRSRLSGVLGELDESSKQELTAAKSTHVDAANTEQMRRFRDQVSHLEEMDKMVAKMEEQTEAKIDGFRCRECNYTDDTPHGDCRKQQHFLERVKVVKRWFSCVKCKFRTTTINQRIPMQSCSHCDSNQFVPAPSTNVNKFKPARRPDEEGLQPRGLEVAKYGERFIK
ncbi:hypothetical protein CAOG_01620 [Capsaspora owczarzaki ATCC 30864]|nr:hypothetical protein CAOG_01620 [Capsaspora owczarzaki ATCC 30864]|eukprot:XP_004364488.1 hypothetical protein CAOG_01620 [Capsaspora owczarzaki ATCC 30864]